MLALASGGNYYRVRGILTAIMDAISPRAKLEFRANGDAFYNGHAADVFLEGEQVGVLGEVSQAGLDKFELRTPATVAEVHLQPLLDAAISVRKHARLPEYPAINYDINLIVPDDVTWDRIREIALVNGGEILEDLEFREIYRDGKLAATVRKKVLFQVSFRSATGTLTHDEANAMHAKMVEACRTSLNAELG